MSRPEGSLNKDSKRVLRELEERGFDLIDEVLKMYKRNSLPMARMFRQIEKVYKHFEDLGEELPPIEVMLSSADLELFKQLRTENLEILSRLFSFCFPKLKAFTVSQSLQEQIVFKININQPESIRIAGSNTIPLSYTKQEALDAPPKKISAPVQIREVNPKQV